MLLDPWGDRIQQGDCLHVFGLSRAALELARIAKRRGAVLVVSPILWYHLRSLWGAERRWYKRLRLLAGFAARSCWPSRADWKRELLQLADAVLPNSTAEARQLVRWFDVPPGRIRVSYNGVDTAWLDRERPGDSSTRDLVLCVGRIEPRKNQLMVIRAVNELGVPLAVVGDDHPEHEAYCHACRAAARANVQFVGPLTHRGPALARLFWRARAVVLASWFETPGLAALEGAAAGTNVVITHYGCTREYFDNLAYYVWPQSVASIRDAIWQAWHVQPPPELMIRVRTRYRWARIGHQLAELYDELLRERAGVPLDRSRAA